MATRLIPMKQLEKNAAATLRECCDSGVSLVIELPDHRFVSIQALEPDKDDDLMNDLLESNPDFQALVRKSALSGKKPFAASGK